MKNRDQTTKINEFVNTILSDNARYKDINKSKFDNGTNLKLYIFRECFRAWFPVLANDQYTQKLFILDLFAGSGTDEDGEYGSPLILLDYYLHKEI